MKNNGLRPTIASMSQEMRRAHWVWAAMIQRCHNPNNKAFARYGAVGVTVCSRWRASFDAFLSDMGIPKSGMTLDRIDSASQYSPDNCRWATRTEQSQNRPTWCIHVEVNGDPMVLKEAWRRFSPEGLTYRALHKRVVTRRWPIAIALLLPSEEA